MPLPSLARGATCSNFHRTPSCSNLAPSRGRAQHSPTCKTSTLRAWQHSTSAWAEAHLPSQGASAVHQQTQGRGAPATHGLARVIPAPEQELRRHDSLPLLLPACLLPLLLPLPALALSGADVITTVATEAGTSLVDVSGDFQTGLSASFLLVLFSEIGDKTFFIAALLAARRPLLEVFAGTFGALGVMTVISVLLGQAFHVLDELIPVRLGESVLPLDDAAAAILLVYFGLTTLRDATQMEDSGESEEEQEAAEVVAQLAPGMMGVKSDSTAQGTDTSAGATSAEATSSSGRGEGVSLPMMASVFALVFLAEWGDKSFFSTIALAAASSPTGVIAGSVAAHSLATLIAVLGGSILASVISEKAVAYVGGVLFLVFAGATVFQIIDKIAG